jgi:hypothetical protein
MEGINFTENLRRVLACAKDESVRLHHEYVGTEHMLIGLTRIEESLGVHMLRNLSVDLVTLRRTIDETVKKGKAQKTNGDLPYTSRAKKVLELSMAEAREQRHQYVGTEHLILGLLREEMGIAAQVLVSLGVTLDAARREMLQILRTAKPPTPENAPTLVPGATVFTNPASKSADQAKAYTTAILDLLGDQDPMTVLGNTEQSLRKALQGVSVLQVAQREAPGKWSIRHVMQHLVDSEIVWSWRLRMILAHDRPAITGYDQDAWADRLGYDETDVAQALEEFRVLRGANLRLLRRATPADRRRFGVHAERGEESVEHMMRLYAGHDILHLNQIERIRQAVGAGLSR